MKALLHAIFNLFFTPAEEQKPITTYFNGTCLQPSPFISSEFVKNGAEINPLWLAWYQDKYNKGFKDTVIAGHDLRQALIYNPQGYFFNEVPPFLVEISILDAPHPLPGRAPLRYTATALSLEWVLWASQEFNIPVQEAHDYGVSFKASRKGKVDANLR